MPIFDIHNYIGGSVIPGVSHNAAAIQATLQERGIESAMLYSNHARYVDPLSGNRILRAMIEQSKNLFGCVVTHTNRIEASVTVLRELMGSSKFLAMTITGVHPDEPVRKVVADEILNAYRRFSKPLIIYTPNASAVEAAHEIARAYSMIKVVLLGMGGEDWRSAIAAAHTTTNIYLETSGVLDRVKLPSAVDVLGTHRILFGSGAPQVDVSAAMGLIEDSAISEEAKHRILYDNARKLFGLAE